MATLRRHAGRLCAAVALLLLGAGIAVQVGVRHHAASARRDLPRALAALPSPSGPATPEASAERAALEAGRRAHRAGQTAIAARFFAQHAETLPTSASLRVAGLSAAATGDLESGARHATLAARLAPGDEALAREASSALDGALLARARGPSWAAIGLGAVTLLFLGGRRRHHVCRRRAREAYVDHLEGHLVVRGGRVDVLLSPRPGATPLPAPSPGPTLALVLSNPSVSRSVRLTPRRDVREDAVRFHLRPDTLAAMEAHPGPWRVQARLDGRLVAEARLARADVAAASA
jgi:hypothetical protein